MAFTADEKNILSSFPTSAKENWIEAAKSELNGAEPFEKLSFTKSGIKILPYYDQSDRIAEASLSIPVSADPYLGPRAWYNMPRINGQDHSANEKALHVLNNGADGILFEIASGSFNEKILNNIDPRYCAVSFLMDGYSKDTVERAKNSLRKKTKEDKINGAFFFKQFPDRAFELAEDDSGLKTMGIVVDAADPQQDVIDSAQKMLQCFDMYTDAGMPANSIAEKMALMLTVDTDFFFSIAKLRAIQLIWLELLKAYGVKEKTLLPIHAVSSSWIKNEYQPHGNMLKSTTAGLAAVLGGCSSLTVEAEDEANSTMNRIARNVSGILREESHLSKVSDPVAGSYYIDHLTHSLAEAAWEKIKQNA
jgi:methylmalonyl-CoA mutase